MTNKWGHPLNLSAGPLFQSFPRAPGLSSECRPLGALGVGPETESWLVQRVPMRQGKYPRVSLKHLRQLHGVSLTVTKELFHSPKTLITS